MSEWEGPWPWMDFDHISKEGPSDNVTRLDWKGYPQSLVCH